MILDKKTYKTFDTLRFVFKASPVYALLHMVMSVVHAIMPTAAMALVTANFVDTATAILNMQRPHDDIYVPLLLLLGVLGIFTTIGSVTNLIFARLKVNVQQQLKPEIVKINAALDFKHIENTESWELISRVSRDPMWAVMEGFQALMQFLQIIVCIASVLVLIVTQVWWAAIVILLFSTPMIWLSIKAGRKNYQAGRDAEKFNRRTEYLTDVLTGREAVDERTLFGFTGEVSRRWHEQYEAGRKLQTKVMAKMFIITKGSSLILALIAILIALTLIGSVVSGDLSAGMFMGIISAVFAMVQQLGWQLSGSLENISKVGEFMKDLTKFLELSSNEEALTEPDKNPMEFESLEFKDVSFKYPTGERNVLQNLSFKLNAGKHYAFVGKNGAGKTTITKLLTGLYTEYEGEIFINDRELREYPAGAIKAMFSVVYQDFAKYYIKFKDNILLGDVAGSYKNDDSPAQSNNSSKAQSTNDSPAQSNDDKIADLITTAGLEELIEELKDGTNTPLGKIKENGQDISGGQWQRIAIARSLVSRAPVKMLDEPTAALDPISESRVYGEFENLMQGKTTVFISHRLGSTKLADEILVIDEGKIIEKGSHAGLMEQNGQYAEMFEAQREWYL